MGFTNAQESLNNDKVSINPVLNLEGTVWINQVFPDIPDCIDSIIFDDSISGLYYSCEHGLHDSITFKLSNDTLFINKFGFISEIDGSFGQEIQSKYFLNFIGDTLKMIDIKHKYGDAFKSIESKFITQKYVKIK